MGLQELSHPWADTAEFIDFVEADGTSRLLVVDDEADIRACLRDLLSLKGYQVEAASSGQEALALLEERSCDLMLLDMRMPGMDGVEVMRHARKARPELPIIVLTAHPCLDSAITAVRLNAVDYLLKPLDVEDLMATVSSALQQHSERRRRRRLLKMMGQVLDTLEETEVSTAPQSTRSSSGQSSPSRVQRRFISVGPVTLDRQKRAVTVKGDSTRRAELTEGETAVLTVLMEYAEDVLSCSRLVTGALGYESDRGEAQSVIRPYIFRLRRKIEEDPGNPRLIRTVRGRGYYFSLA